MKRVVVTAIVAIGCLLPVEASAIVRYLVQDMTCSEVKEALKRDGAAILFRRGKSGVALYDRFVKDATMCPAGNITAQEGIPTADTQSCRVSKCIDQSRFGD